MKFIFATLPLTCVSYAFPVLSVRYLSNEHYKNEKSSGRYNGRVFLSRVREKMSRVVK
jgi:hypothetical protein